MKNRKKVLFVHYRVGERDGVGLEIAKRAKCFEKLGVDVYYLTGYDGLSYKNSFVVKEIDIRTNLNRFLREIFFKERVFDESVVINLYYHLENKIHKKIQRVFDELKPNLVFVHNMFSHAFNLPATTALINVLDHEQSKTVVVNHDFWFERKILLKPKYFFAREILQSLPPSRPYFLKQQVINSSAQKQLFKRRGIKAEVIGDYFDFSKPMAKHDHYNSDFSDAFGIGENDLIILHATRITVRKAIENAIYLAHFLEKMLKKIAPLKVNGKEFTKDSRVVLFLPNFIEVDANLYYKSLVLLAEKLKVKAVFAGDRFMPERQKTAGLKKYGFWESYLFADLITYTSFWEGFGNQFLEAIAFKKLPVVFEYPVFKADIKKEGYQYVSLGDKIRRRDGFHFIKQDTIKEAALRALMILKNKKRLKEMVETNFKIARSLHDQSLLLEDLKEILNTGVLP